MHTQGTHHCYMDWSFDCTKHLGQWRRPNVRDRIVSKDILHPVSYICIPIIGYEWELVQKAGPVGRNRQCG